MPNRFSPFIRVFYNDQEVTPKFESFQYVYSEEDDDECILNITVKNRKEADRPEYSDNARLKIQWGFIGFPFQTRIVYVHECKWRYSQDSAIKATITCGEKAIVMKQETSRAVYKNVSILDILNQMGKKYDIAAYLQIPKLKLDYKGPQGVGNYEEIKKFFNGNVQAANLYIQVNKDTPNRDGSALPTDTSALIDLKKNEGTLKDISGKWQRELQPGTSKVLKPIPGKKETQEQRPMQDLSPSQYQQILELGKQQTEEWKALNSFNRYEQVPQAGKTDKALLAELAEKETGGPYVVESRDDGITLKKRDFSQRPYRSYSWGDSPDLLEFAAESRNKVKNSASNKVGFGFWDKADKTFFHGNVDVMNSPEVATLAKFKYLRDNLAKKDPNAILREPGSLAQGSITTGPKFGFDNQGKATIGLDGPRADGTARTYMSAIDPTVMRVSTKLRQLDFLIESLSKTINLHQQRDDPAAAYSEASNIRGKSEQTKNPATARFVLDENLKTGMIITIVSIANKHEGNYYIIKASHMIGSGYAYTECELVRDGSNAKESDRYLPSTKVKQIPNTTIGPASKNKNQSKKITTK